MKRYFLVYAVLPLIISSTSPLRLYCQINRVEIVNARYVNKDSVWLKFKVIVSGSNLTTLPYKLNIVVNYKSHDTCTLIETKN